MRFQVVMPCLNAERYIREAVTSVLAQEGPFDIELIVVDGASSDRTVLESEQAAVGSRHRVLVLSAPDGGQSEAINRGVAGGDGDVVSWLNADDRLRPGALAAVVRAFRSAPEAVLVYGNVQEIDDQGRPLRALQEQSFRRADLVWGPCYIPQPSTFVKRDAWVAAGGLDESLHYAMDLDLWLRLSLQGPFVHVPELLSDFRLHADSKTVAHHVASRREAMQVRRRHGAVLLGREPSRLELEARHLLVRCRRKARFARQALGGAGA